MFNEGMIASYLELQEFQHVLRKTRGSTNKLLEENKLEFKNVEIKEDFHFAVFKVNGRSHEIKLLPDDEIVDVSCPDCKGIKII